MPKPDISRNLRQFQALDVLRLLSPRANRLKSWLFCWWFGICSFFLFRLFPLVSWGKRYILASEQDECDAYVLYRDPICASQNLYWKECHGKLTSPRLQLLHPGKGKHGLCNTFAFWELNIRCQCVHSSQLVLPVDPGPRYFTLNSCTNAASSAKGFQQWRWSRCPDDLSGLAELTGCRHTELGFCLHLWKCKGLWWMPVPCLCEC